MQSEIEPMDYGDTVGRHFLDKLLLGIIDANAVASNSKLAAVRLRGERLRAAREALLGCLNAEGRPPENDDTVLRWIGSQHHNDLSRQGLAQITQSPKPKARSVRQLVSEAVARFGLTSSSEERLRKKLNPDGLEKWLDIADLHDDIPEQLDMNLLQEIQQILGRRGILIDLTAVEK